MRHEYARNSYHDEYIDLPPRSYSRVLPRLYSRASSHTFSCVSPRTSFRVLPQFTHGPNHHSYGFGSRETTLSLDALDTVHVQTVVIVSHIGQVFLLEGPTLTLSQDTWMVHVFPIMVHVTLSQMVSWKGL
jgi:hypothetical protein